ncbi:uncharacterized protein LOC119728147 [Patiria miniata]|uniref:Uncharacterized protein n=1 Tax=Patiria miniata TaxID=46514 RepID=A0A913ZWW4_PATMI|nr:uncharacterized protein LOC119728147 [Patiria miniata]
MLMSSFFFRHGTVESSLSECEYRTAAIGCGDSNNKGAGVTCVYRTTEGATPKSPAGDVGSDAQGSNSGTYIGLAVGCVLFVVCVSVIVVCFLKRHKRQDKPTPTATLHPSAGSQQHSNTRQIPAPSAGGEVDDHYYSSAKLDTTKPSDPPEDSVYTYADAPRGGANNRPPNTDFFMIEEGGNSMGSPQQPAIESEYAYADPTQLREESPDETEGWVENIVYVAGP